MSDAVVELRPGTSLELRRSERIEPSAVLNGAIAKGLTQVVVIGRSLDGELYIASSEGVDTSLALLARATASRAVVEDLGLFSEADA